MELERHEIDKIKMALKKMSAAGNKLDAFYKENSLTFTYQNAFEANQLARELGEMVTKYESLLGKINKLPSGKK